MQRAMTTYSSSRMDIMELPYKIHHDLSKFLDPVGTMDWKHLVSLIPIYTAKDVKQMETEASKPGMSFTRHLLEDMDNRGYSVDNLENFLKMLGNKRALGCLLAGVDDESLLHDTATAQNRKGRIRPSIALEEPSDQHTMKRLRVDHPVPRPAEEIDLPKNPDPGTRKTLRVDHPVPRTAEEIDLRKNPDPGTRETLRVGHPISRPAEEIDLCKNPDPGTRETLRVGHPISRPAEEIDLCKNPDPGTRETLRVGHPISRSAEEIDFCKNPDPGTRETLRVDHPISRPAEEIGFCKNPDPGTRGTSKMGHPIHQPTDEIHFCKNPDPGTRETLKMSHDIFQYRCEMSEIQGTVGYNREVRNRYQSKNMPSENDDTHSLDAIGHTAQAPMHCPSTPKGQKVPIEHEDL